MTESTTKFNLNIGQSFGITVIVILGMIIFSPINLLLNQFIGKEASMLIYYLLSIGIPFWIIYSIEKRRSDVHSFNFSIKNKRIIPFIIIGAVALLFGIVTPISSLIPMPDSIKKMFMDFAGHTGIFSFILMVIAAPVLEELIFRGIILEGLLKKYSPAKSILVSSLLFGIVHLNPWQFVTGLFLGIFIGWIYYKTRSLSYAMIIHAAANLSGFIMRFFIEDDSLMDGNILDMYGGLTNLILAIIGSILIIIICIYFLQKQFKKKELT